MIKLNRDPHTGGYAYIPLKSVTGFFGPGIELLPLVKELNDLGYAADRIEIFKGTLGAEELDTEGKKHGLWVRFMRGLEELFADEYLLFQRAKEILESGGGVVAVFPHGHEPEWRKVGEILNRHGASDVTHWGKWIIETMV